MTKKTRKPRLRFEGKRIDVFQTILDEIAEAVELQRPYFPNDDEDTLRSRAMEWRRTRYATGRWPDFAELAKDEAILNAVYSRRQQESAVNGGECAS
jgi:hypothetical protein